MDLEKLIEAVRQYQCLWDVSNCAYKDRRKKENARKEITSQFGDDVSPEDCVSRWKTLRDKFVREIKKVKGKKSGDAGPSYTPCWLLFSIRQFLTDSINHRTHTNLSTPEPASQAASEMAIEADIVPGTTSMHESLDDFIEEQRVVSEVPPRATSEAPSRAPSEASRAVISEALRTSTPQPPAKRRRGGESNDADEMFIREMARLDERRAEREERRAEREERHGNRLDEDDLFGQQIAAVMRRFTNVKKSRARIQVLQLLDNIEFSDAQDQPYPSHQYNF